MSGEDAGQEPVPGLPRERVHRPIRSYVLRQGRMSPAQERALGELGPRYLVPFQCAALDPFKLFGRCAPLVLEIGCGMGETTVAIATQHPERDFLGIEVHGPGVGSVLAKANALGLANLRMIRHDAVEVVDAMIAPGSLDGIHIYFPDPWPKARHHKRRLLKATFVHALAQRLAPEGYLHTATDWAPYAEEMLATLSGEALLANTAQGYAARPAWRPETKFEKRGKRLGHEVFDLLFERVR